MDAQLDKIDRKILNLLQVDNRLSAELIAEKVGSSRSAVQRRIKSMREAGVIAADVSVLSPELTEDRITAIVTVKMDNTRSDILEAFSRGMKELSEVQQVYFISGDIDFVVVLTAPSLGEYDKFAKKYFADNKSVYRYRSNIVSERIKAGLQVPLDV